MIFEDPLADIPRGLTEEAIEKSAIFTDNLGIVKIF
jgi:hypothetical protein